MNRTPDQLAGLWQQHSEDRRYSADAMPMHTLAVKLYDAVNTCATRDAIMATIRGCLMELTEGVQARAEEEWKATMLRAKKNARLECAHSLRKLVDEWSEK